MHRNPGTTRAHHPTAPRHERAAVPRRAHPRPRRSAGALVVSVLAVLGALLLTASPARAGGPTSVLAVNYDGARAAAALTGSQAYDDLVRALDANSTPVGEPSAEASFMGVSVRLTWLIHDVTPWRIDAVLIYGDDVWVETTTATGETGGLFAQPGVRHRPVDTALLLRTLTSLGVLGAAPSGPVSGSQAGTGAGRDPAAAAVPAARPVASTAVPGDAGMPWLDGGSRRARRARAGHGPRSSIGDAPAPAPRCARRHHAPGPRDVGRRRGRRPAPPRRRGDCDAAGSRARRLQPRPQPGPVTEVGPEPGPPVNDRRVRDAPDGIRRRHGPSPSPRG